MLPYQSIEELPREKLLELCGVFGKNWLATDGLWFQGVEKVYGYESALQIDIDMWKDYTVVEAKRIIEFLQLPPRAGLEGLRQALAFRLYAPVNTTELYYEDDGALIYKTVTCRVQAARERKGMTYHTCKPVAIQEYTYFALTVDDRITTEAVSCHPDVTDTSCHCMWRFRLSE